MHICSSTAIRIFTNVARLWFQNPGAESRQDTDVPSIGAPTKEKKLHLSLPHLYLEHINASGAYATKRPYAPFAHLFDVSHLRDVFAAISKMNVSASAERAPCPHLFYIDSKKRSKGPPVPLNAS